VVGQCNILLFTSDSYGEVVYILHVIMLSTCLDSKEKVKVLNVTLLNSTALNHIQTNQSGTPIS